ncbi:MAG: hypothetical protein JNN20_14005 [Betaproteobacteria bacterium]|nr:hypothetical protein [Betaproteobacteria bacterium]
MINTARKMKRACVAAFISPVFSFMFESMHTRILAMIGAMLVVWYVSAGFVSEYLFSSRIASEAIFDLLIAYRGRFAIPEQPTIDTLVFVTNLAGGAFGLFVAAAVGYCICSHWAVKSGPIVACK